MRNAARVALENMGIPEAMEVLKVTRIIEDEISALQGTRETVEDSIDDALSKLLSDRDQSIRQRASWNLKSGLFLMYSTAHR